MRVAVIGAGIIGVTTAYELGRRRPRGDRVRAPRHASPRRRSFANAGVVAPGYVTPWAAPGMPAQGRAPPASPRMRRCGSRGRSTPRRSRWMWRWWRACQLADLPRQPRAHAAPRPLQPRAPARADASDLQLDYERSAGLPRAAAQRKTASWRSRAAARARASSASRFERPRRRRRAARSSPGLNPRRRCTPASTCRTTRSATAASSRTCCARKPSAPGARFRFNAHVERSPAGAELRVVQRRTTRATGAALARRDGCRRRSRSRRDAEPSFDAVVVCAGVDSRRAAAPARPAPAAGAGARLLGHRAAAPRRPHLHHAPRSGADGRALQGRDQPPRQARARRRQRRDRRRPRAAERRARQATLVQGAATTGFPARHRERSAAQHWKGARPMLPDGPPVLGRERHAEASGSTSATARSGWALSCGSARLVADAMVGRTDRRSTSTASASSGSQAMTRRSSASTARSAAHRRCSTSPRRARSKAKRCAALPPYTLMARAGVAVARLALALAPHARTHLDRLAARATTAATASRPRRDSARWGKPTTVLRVGDRRDASRRCAPGARPRARGRRRDPRLRRRRTDRRRSTDLAIDALLGIGASRAARGRDRRRDRPHRSARGARRARARDRRAVGPRRRRRPAARRGLRQRRRHAHAARRSSPASSPAAAATTPARSGFDDLGVDAARRQRRCLARRHAPTRRARSRRDAMRATRAASATSRVVGGAPGMAGAALARGARRARGRRRTRVRRPRRRPRGGEAADAIDPVRPELMFRRGWRTAPPPCSRATTVVCGCGGGDAVRAALPKLLVGRRSPGPRCRRAQCASPPIRRCRRCCGARSARGHATVLTPHPLEAARLLGGSAADVQADRLARGARAGRALRAAWWSSRVGHGDRRADGTTARSTPPATRARERRHRRRARRLDRRPLGIAAASAFDVATRAVIEHGAAAEPEAPVRCAPATSSSDCTGASAAR